MQHKNKSVNVLNSGFLILGILIVFYSLWNLLIKKIYLPYMLLLVGGFLLSAMFGALTIAKRKGRMGVAWTVIALLNSLLLIYLYFNPNHLKELYPLSIWIFLTILISSLQHVLERLKKRYHSIMRIFNFGLILVLIPVYFLKSDIPIIWAIFSWLTLLIMLSNLTLFLLPVRHQNQSK